MKLNINNFLHDTAHSCGSVLVCWAGGDDITLNLTLCIQWTARWPGLAFTLRIQNIKYNYLVSDYFSPEFFRLKVL